MNTNQFNQYLFRGLKELKGVCQGSNTSSVVLTLSIMKLFAECIQVEYLEQLGLPQTWQTIDANFILLFPFCGMRKVLTLFAQVWTFISDRVIKISLL